MPAYPTKNRGGRPALAPGRAASSQLTTWLRPGEHDRLAAEAARAGKPISSYVRDLVRLKLR